MKSSSMIALTLAFMLLAGCRTSPPPAEAMGEPEQPVTGPEGTEVIIPPPTETTGTDTAPVTIPAPEPAPLPQPAPAETAPSPATAVLSPSAPAPAPSAPAPAPEMTKIEHVDAEQAKQLLTHNDEIVVLDVRTPAEYDAGHIPGALNFNYNAGDFAKKVNELDKARSYLVHCGSGGRSTRSLEVFKEEGFQTIYHLDGGLNAWKNIEGPVVPSPVPPKQ